MLEPMPCSRVRLLGFQASAERGTAEPQPADDREQPDRDDDAPDGDRADAAGQAGAAEIRHRGEPEQGDHAEAGDNRRGGEKREEPGKIAKRRDGDRHVADGEGEKVEEEDEEVAGFAVGVLGIGRHAAGAGIENTRLGKAIGDGHRAERRHDP